MDAETAPINVMEFERLAAQRLPASAWAYYSSGAGDEYTLRRNVEALRELALHYRVLIDVSERDLSSELLSTRVALPVLLAPTAFHKLAHADGEVASARAAHAADTLMVLSTLSTSAVEEVAAAHDKLWFQLYVYKDRGATAELVERVQQAGVRALVLTVDAPLLGRREADVRNRFALPEGLHIENLRGREHARVSAQQEDSGLAAYFQRALDPSLSYRELEWLCSTARVPVLVKGLVRADDARRALAHGARGVIVSNHGGRQLDGSPASIEALPRVADAIGDDGVVLMDGGIRRGADVVKALALGARAVLLGRPILWGLAVGGEAGVRHVLRLFHEELDLAMALCGCPSLAHIDRSLVWPGAVASL